MKYRFVDAVEVQALAERMVQIDQFCAIGMVAFLSLVRLVFDTPNRA